MDALKEYYISMKKQNLFIGILILLFIQTTEANNICILKKNFAYPPTDTILWHEFDSMPGVAYLLTYAYSNGHGYFFGTNFLDLDQNPATPDQNGIPSFAQGFKCDTSGYKITEVLFLVGRKIKDSDFGTPLIASIQLLDDSTTYTVNTSSGSVTYTIASPGTNLSSFSVPWDDIVETSAMNFDFTVAKLPSPVEVNRDYAVVVDLFDFYMNGDRIGFMTAGNGSASGIFGKKYTLWRYPDPLLWLQVSHLYSGIDRSIGIFPVIDDGTSGIENDSYTTGMKLGYAYPNPSNGKITIEYAFKESGNQELLVVDQHGQTHFRKKLQHKVPGKYKIHFDAQHLSSGIYYIMIHDEHDRLTRKIQIIH